MSPRAGGFDVAVVGLGAVGGAVAYQLARRGAAVVGIDRFAPPHRHGSSHGETRIMRQAIGEGAHYTRFVLRANAIWEEAEAELGLSLVERCGFLFIAHDDEGSCHHGRSGFLAATRDAARQHGIAHELLAGAEIARRFPQFTGLDGSEQAYHEPGGGYLRAEACVAAQLTLARRHGAVVRTGVPVRAVDPDGAGVVVRTAAGDVRAGSAIVAAGAWLPGLGGDAARLPLAVSRQTLHWFPVVDGSAWRPDASPTFIWAHGTALHEQFYGFPPVAGAVKVAEENEVARPDPDAAVEAPVTAGEARSIAAQVRARLAGLADAPARSEPCLYTSTPDHDFVVAADRRGAAIRLVSACSGHGFKHAAAIGEAVAAQWAGDARPDLHAFAPARFAVPAARGPAHPQR